MWKAIAGAIVGLATIIGLVVAVFALMQQINDSDAQNSIQQTQIALLEDQLAVQQAMATLQAIQSDPIGSAATQTAISQQLISLESTRVALATQARPLISPWKLSTVLLNQNFEGDIVVGLSPISGNWNRIEDLNNHLWRVEGSGAMDLQVVTGVKDYAVQFKIRQISGARGLGGIYIRAGSGGCPAYLFYISNVTDQIKIVEKS